MALTGDKQGNHTRNVEVGLWHIILQYGMYKTFAQVAVSFKALCAQAKFFISSYEEQLFVLFLQQLSRETLHHILLLSCLSCQGECLPAMEFIHDVSGLVGIEHVLGKPSGQQNLSRSIVAIGLVFQPNRTQISSWVADCKHSDSLLGACEQAL